MISQEVIDLYDDYTHKPLDRRSFMGKLAKITGSSAAALALLPLLKNDYARAAIISEDDSTIEISEETQNGVSYYIAKPKGKDNLKTILIIHENRGLNPHIKDIARRLAKDGYLAITPDGLSLVGGTPSDEDKARDMIRKLDKASTLKLYLDAASFAKSHKKSNQSVGVIGFCWGGGLANKLASHSNDVRASVAYYGRQLSLAEVKNIKSPLLLHYAGLDKRINAGILDYVDSLTTQGVEFSMHLYKDVNHAFNNDTNISRYNKDAANLSWSRTMAFFKNSL